MEEYLLTLEIKRRKKEYGDFLRGITPLLADIFEVISREKLGFDVANYSKIKNDIRFWDIGLLQGDLKIWNALNKEYRGKMKEGPINSDSLLVIIRTLSKDAKLNMVCDTLRKIEGSIRNIAAHEIVYVSDIWIQKRTGLLPDKIVNKLTEALSFVDTNAGKTDFLDSYDKLNEVLLRELNMVTDDTK